MILADKIINERKRNAWSQEELADKLGVSRQAVSKWESAQSVPDIQRVIQMAQLFGVSTDYLLTGCATQLQDISHLHHVVQDAQEKLGAELLLRGPDGTARAPTDADLAAFLAALLA